MAAKTTPGFSGNLTSILEADDTSIPLSTLSQLKERLSQDGDFTTLLIQDTVGYEVVKVLNFRGELVLERGLSGTTPKRFPTGSCVSFVPSDELFKSFACEADCCEGGADETYGTEAPPPTGNTPSGYMFINGKKFAYFD